jgi:branched-chain amino acid transport system substrate-binding protein
VSLRKFMKKTPLITLALLLVLTAAAPGCGGGGDTQNGAQQGSGDEKPIPVGFSAPLTGSCAKAGQDMVDGARMAVEEVNAAGGVLGRKIELVVEDDGGDPQMAVQGANKLVSRGIDAAMGYYNSGAANPTLPVYSRAGLPVILVAVAATNLTRQGYQNIVRIQGYNDQQGEVAAKAMLDKFNAKKAAIVRDNTASPRGMADATVQWIKKLKPETEIMLEEITPGEKDFSAVVTKVKGFDPDALYFTGFYAEGSMFLKQLRSAGVSCQFLAGDGNTDPAFIEVAGKDAEGVIMTAPPMASNLPGAAEFIERFTQKYGSPPAAYAVYSYDAVHLLADAIGRANSVDKAAVISALRSTDGFKALTGDIAFDENGDLQRAGYILVVVKDGKFVTYTD